MSRQSNRAEYHPKPTNGWSPTCDPHFRVHGGSHMSNIHDTRQLIDAKLAKWEASAEAFEAQLAFPKDKAAERF